MRLFSWYFRWFLPASIIKTEILKGKKATKFGAIAIGPTQTFAPTVLAFYLNKIYQVFSEKISTYDILIVHVGILYQKAPVLVVIRFSFIIYRSCFFWKSQDQKNLWFWFLEMFQNEALQFFQNFESWRSSCSSPLKKSHRTGKEATVL